MFKKLLLTAVSSVTFLYAHTPIMSCFDNSDGTITCEGGFSDGTSASGVAMHIKQKAQVILEGKMNEFSEFTFQKPSSAYTVHFDAGEGHLVTIDGKDILE